MLVVAEEANTSLCSCCKDEAVCYEQSRTEKTANVHSWEKTTEVLVPAIAMDYATDEANQ